MHSSRASRNLLCVLGAALGALLIAGPAMAGAGPMFRAPGYQLAVPAVFAGNINAADLDGDGAPDIVCGMYDTFALAIARGQGGGSFGPFHAWFPGRGEFLPVVADFDGDGRPDVGGGATIDNPDNSSTSELLVAFGDGQAGVADSFEVAIAPTSANSACAGDLDGDGRADLVVCLADSQVVVYHANANRTFTLAATLTTPGAPTRAAIGDVTGDGHPDVVVTCGSEFAGLSVFAGDGAGNLAARVDLPGAPAGDFLALGQLDGTPGLDVLTANTTGQSFASNLGNGSFGSTIALPQADPGYGLALGDLDGDGKLDVLSVNTQPADRMLHAWRGDGAGGFGPRLDSRPTAQEPEACALADVNGDGILDALYIAHLTSIVGYAPGRGDGTFGSPMPPAVPIQATGLAVGDFDNDGKVDAVASDLFGGSLAFAHGTGDANFVPIVVSAPIAHDYNFLAAGFFDADANLDLVGVDVGSPRLSFLRGHGDGTFDAPVDFALGSGPGSPTLVDLDGDGRMDVVVPCTAGVLDAFHDGPTGLTALAPEAVPAGVTAVRYADLDGDGKLDRVLTCTGQVLVQQGNGAGAFTTTQSVPETRPPGDLQLADVDGDGRLDILASRSGTSGTPVAMLQVMKGQAGGTFAAPSTVDLDWYPLPNTPVGAPSIGKFVVVDVDGDGKLDLVGRVGGMFAARGHGDGTFDTPEVYSAGGSPGQFALADLDADGRTDVVAACAQTIVHAPFVGSIVPLRNQTGGIVGVAPAPGAPGPRAALALSRVMPNPSPGRFAFTLTAARAGTARLALYSAAGREVAARDPVAIVAGANALTLDAGAARLPSGVYWLRAGAGEASATSKVVVLGR